MNGDKVDIIYSNIKHAFFQVRDWMTSHDLYFICSQSYVRVCLFVLQPSKGEMIALLHFHLKVCVGVCVCGCGCGWVGGWVGVFAHGAWCGVHEYTQAGV